MNEKVDKNLIASLLNAGSDDDFCKSLDELNIALDNIISGKKAKEITRLNFDLPIYNNIIDKVNLLNNNLSEINILAGDLSKGDIDGVLPSRRNFIAGPFKNLHSQLSILAWSMRQLQQGHVISKLEEGGELYDAFNDLIDTISNSSIYDEDDGKEVSFKWSSMNSWRFHKILTALNHLKIAVIEVNENRKVVYANQQGKEILNHMDAIPLYDEEKKDSDLLNIIAKHSINNRKFPVEYEVYDSDSALWYKITTDYFPFANGNNFFLHIIDNINEWKVSESQLIQTATMDAMTGTLNREAGLIKLNEIINDNTDTSHSAAFVDLDGLKYVNDTYGHREGDYFIKTVSHILLSNIRDSDMVIRYGGDEFLIIFKNCQSKVAEKIINRMYIEISKLNAKKVKPFELAFSHGLVNFNSNSNDTVSEILTNADIVMYENKRAKQHSKDN